jgi:hypothetical protein
MTRKDSDSNSYLSVDGLEAIGISENDVEKAAL